MARPIAFISEFTEEIPGDRIHRTEARRWLPVRPHPAMRYGAWTASRPARAPGHADRSTAVPRMRWKEHQSLDFAQRPLLGAMGRHSWRSTAFGPTMGPFDLVSSRHRPERLP
jgi:hypothetical protein